MSRLIALIVAAGMVACSGSEPVAPGSGCVPNRVEACPCPGGLAGTQTCLPDRTFGACVCADAGVVDVTAPDSAPPDATVMDATVMDATVADTFDAASDLGEDVPPESAADVPMDSTPDVGLDGGLDAPDLGVDTGPCSPDLQTDPDNCGACGRRCAERPNTIGRLCRAGACVAPCATSFADCDMNEANGCEIDTRTDPAHCGVCGQACNLPNAATACVAGRCAITTCTGRFADCNMSAADGCEANLDTSASHCGRCDTACMFAGATAACVAGSCSLAMCASGRGDCDRNAGNGCEVETATSLAHCGGCGQACSFAHAGAACAGGACSLGACDTGFANCNASRDDGCETATGADPMNCGACGMTCTLANAQANCTGGRCAVAACTGTFGDCDANAANGCEADTQTSSAHCGACNRACAPGDFCGLGRCVACPFPRTFCPSTAACVDTNNDAANCGACGRRCATGEYCNAGRCLADVAGQCPPSCATNTDCDRCRMTGDTTSNYCCVLGLCVFSTSTCGGGSPDAGSPDGATTTDTGVSPG
jgi:hypothetical protein